MEEEVVTMFTFFQSTHAVLCDLLYTEVSRVEIRHSMKIIIFIKIEMNMVTVATQ